MKKRKVLSIMQLLGIVGAGFVVLAMLVIGVIASIKGCLDSKLFIGLNVFGILIISIAERCENFCDFIIVIGSVIASAVILDHVKAIFVSAMIFIYWACVLISMVANGLKD